MTLLKSSLLRLATPAASLLLLGPNVAGAQQVAPPRVDAAANALAPAVDTSYRAPGSTRGAGPNGATLRCRDGSYPAPKAPDSACASKGGIMVRFPLLNTPAPLARAAAPATQLAPPAAVKLPDPAPSRANVLVPAERVPADATLLCGDGTFIRADTTASRCASRGGVKGRFPQARERQ